MMLISTYGTNKQVGKDKLWTTGGDRINFMCQETVKKHY